MARPRKTAGERRDLQIGIRLTPSEAEALQTRAQAAGLSVTEYARRMMAHGQVRVVQSQEPDFAVLDQLRRIGVNLNQLARAMNTSGQEAPDGLGDLCRKIESLIDRAVSRGSA